MEKEFVTYEIALKLKELGFDEPCIAYWKNNKEWHHPILCSEFKLDNSRTDFYNQCNNNEEISAPLYQQVIEWFIKTYKINCVAGYTNDDEEFMAIIDRPNQDIDYNMNSTKFYPEAREQAILKCIELLKSK